MFRLSPSFRLLLAAEPPGTPIPGPPVLVVRHHLVAATQLELHPEGGSVDDQLAVLELRLAVEAGDYCVC